MTSPNNTSKPSDASVAKAGICVDQLAQVSECKNMLPVEGDLSMEYEYYECKVCGSRLKLDYEEMR